MKTLKTNYLGKKYLEQCPKITIKSLFDKIEKELKKELLDINLEGVEIIQTKANYGGYRNWFKCPKCNNKAFTLYNINGNLICRKCSNLPYRKQRYKGMIEESILN
ncbi:MAG: hypothetical protein GY828_05660 [Candidatus Gracilibacteria bacterium]|nr:hypothetical protein [Candidatus Gracilibacteria bacterium]